MRMLKGGLARHSPQVTGLRVTSSAYGMTIPVVYGHCRVPGKCIAAGNFQSHSGGLSGGSGSGGGGTTYSANFDLLLGYGPMEGIGQIWLNNGQYGAYCPDQPTVGSGKQTFTGTGPATTFTFTVNNNSAALMLIRGVVLQQSFSVTYNDYGSPGSRTLTGTTLLPLYNDNFPAPNNGIWHNAGIPYATYNTSGPGNNPTVTVVFPSAVSNITVIVYYNQAIDTSGSGENALQYLNLQWEQQLGSGSEYSASGMPAQIIYPDFSGIGASNFSLGAINAVPDFNFEVKGLFGYGPNGDCNPADIIADIICSGNYWHGENFGVRCWNHGLGFTAFPETTIFGGINVNPNYSRWQGILSDEPNLWGGSYGGGSNLGLNAIRNYCQAYGIFVSGTMDQQQNAAQWLDELCAIANCAPVWTGEALYFIPYCEVSNYGNGASYVAPTASGPLFTFTDSHFKAKKPGEAPLVMTRERPSPNYNSLPVQFRDRGGVGSGQFSEEFKINHVTVSENMDVTVQGPMPGSSKNLEWVQDPATAISVGTALLRRDLICKRNPVKGTLVPNYGMLFTPMDLVLLADASMPDSPFPVRFTKMVENPDFSIDFEAEKFIYGASSPSVAGALGNPQTPSGGGTNPAVAPGSVNSPIIFEATPKIAALPQIWLGLSGSNPNYGGCVIWLSTDGGSTYQIVGSMFGRSTMGLVYSANYPTHADPDAADTLNVDLTQSLGSLASFTTAQRDLFQSLIYLDGGGTIGGLTIPYELLAYATATLASANKYSLPPTIRRGVFSTTTPAHNIGTKFLFVNDPAVPPFKLNLDPNWIGLTLHFKFTAFNLYGSNQELLANVTDYTFAPGGLVGFTITPGGGTGGGTVGGGGWSVNPSTFPTVHTFTPATDGVTTTFTVASGSLPSSFSLYLNGIFQSPTTNYTISGNTITFTTAPATGDVIEAVF